MKVTIHGEEKFSYPDLFITREENTPSNTYAKLAPAIIVEVASEAHGKKILLINLYKIKNFLL